MASVMSVIVPTRPLKVEPSISAVETAATHRILPFWWTRYSIWNTGIGEVAYCRAAETRSRS